MQAKKIIEENLKKVIEEFSDTEAEIDASQKLENGDYYTNVAMRLAGALKQKPLDIAYQIKEAYEKLEDPIVERVEVAPPGFVNFFLTEKYLIETVGYVIKKGDEFGKSDTLKGKKIVVEYIDPNPFKEFHIGHLYQAAIGESLARLYEFQGADVVRACYQGDVGLHVAKAIYGMLKLLDEMPKDDAPLSLRAQFMGRSYAYGAGEFEKSDDVKEEIKILNKKIYEKTDPKLVELYDLGRAWSLEYFDSLYKRLGTKFDKFYFESQVADIGLELVREFQKKGIFRESDGAIIFPGKEYGLHNRVFINSLGLPTYEAKEMGLAPTKYKDTKYDESIIVTGNEVDDYFKVVLKALEQINPDLASKTKHISNGMVVLEGGKKMSSRTGNILTGEWLMDEAASKIGKAYPELDSETTEKVGVGAIKYALLKSTIGRQIEFNFDDSISLSGASGPYLQYAYVRTKSILDKDKISHSDGIKDYAVNTEELAILRRLVHFKEIVETAQIKLAPNFVASYLFELAQDFNFFYQKHKVSGNKFRLELTNSVGITLANGLNLLGIDTVNKL